MKLPELAKAIVCWAEYETLCDREALLSEASLKYPIGEFLIATQDHELKPEEPYPKAYQQPKGRPKAMDFCLRRRGGKRPWWAILESKWITNRRDFNLEIFGDLLRLELVRRQEQAETFDRLFLVAGGRKNVRRWVFDGEINPGGGGQRIRLFESILPAEVGKILNVSILEAHEKIHGYWHSAAKSSGQKNLPTSLKVELVAACDFPEMTYGCWIWRVRSVGGRSTRPLGEFAKPSVSAIEL